MTDEELTAAAKRFQENYIWPRYGAFGGPDENECEEIVRAVLTALEEKAHV